MTPDYKLSFENETKTNLHKYFYDQYRKGWSEISIAYESFIEKEILQIFSKKIVYQAFPSIRFHLPGDQAIHYWHCDSDENHNHPDWEINFHLAITDINHESQALWAETVPGLEDFTPMIMNYGEFYVFNGNKCIHGNKENKTNKTRVSFDFRVMPFERYVTSNKKHSATSKKKFVIGDYYKEAK